MREMKVVVRKKAVMSRDDFTPKVREQIARRAAYTCSNPDCRRRTLIPEVSNQTDAIYNGVASHITAAAIKGPRYDKSLTNEQRSSIENGIHLCRLCANKVDANGGKDYPAPLLREWKILHEDWLREQQKNESQQRREYGKKWHTLYGDDPIYEFVPEERASGYIIVPDDNSTQSSRFITIIGRIDKTIANSTYWIAISPQPSLDHWWPQNECILSTEGFWTVEKATLGRNYPEGKEDIGRKFDIGLYETTMKAHQLFQDASVDGLGIVKPDGAFLLWKISVTRTA
jgi:hypothetical protein